VVQDHVDAPLAGEGLHGLRKIGGLLVVDDQVHAQGLYAVHLLGRGRHDELRVRDEGPAELNGRRVDPSPAPVQQCILVIAQFPEDEHVQEGRDVRLADAGRLLEAHAVGDRHGVARVGHGVLSVASPPHEGHDAVPPFPSGHAGPRLLDYARDLQSQDVGLSRRRRVLARPLDQVGPVHGGCHDADEHLAFRRLWPGRFPDPQHLDAPEPFHQDRFHETSLHADGTGLPSRSALLRFL